MDHIAASADLPAPASGFVSTGELPPDHRVEALVQEAHARFRGRTDGACSSVYPALQRADPSTFGLAVVSTDGRRHGAGDVGVRATLMSVSKPFVLALVCELLGADHVRRAIGVNATGLPFDSVEAVARSGDGRTNPMVNSGAIATTALVPGADADERWRLVIDGLSRFAGRPLELDEATFESASTTNHRNRAIAALLDSMGALEGDPAEAVDRYTRQCCLTADADDLATMAATLANGGTNPVTGEVVVSPAVCHDVLAVMATAGMYDDSGDWLWQVGLPGKSGISGAMVTVSPGKGGLGVLSPPLDPIGNSVRGQLATRYLATELGLDVFATTPRRT